MARVSWAAILAMAFLVLDAGGVARAGQGRCEVAEAMDKGELMLSCSVTAPDRKAGIRPLSARAQADSSGQGVPATAHSSRHDAR